MGLYTFLLAALSLWFHYCTSEDVPQAKIRLFDQFNETTPFIWSDGVIQVECPACEKGKTIQFKHKDSGRVFKKEPCESMRSIIFKASSELGMYECLVDDNVSTAYFNFTYRFCSTCENMNCSREVDVFCVEYPSRGKVSCGQLDKDACMSPIRAALYHEPKAICDMTMTAITAPETKAGNNDTSPYVQDQNGHVVLSNHPFLHQMGKGPFRVLCRGESTEVKVMCRVKESVHPTRFEVTGQCPIDIDAGRNGSHIRKLICQTLNTDPPYVLENFIALFDNRTGRPERNSVGRMICPPKYPVDSDHFRVTYAYGGIEGKRTCTPTIEYHSCAPYRTFAVVGETVTYAERDFEPPTTTSALVSTPSSSSPGIECGIEGIVEYMTPVMIAQMVMWVFMK